MPFFELILATLVGLVKVACRLVRNPAAMVVAPMTINDERATAVFSVVTRSTWNAKKKRRVKMFSHLELVDTPYEIPAGSPILKWINAGLVKTARLVNIPRGMKGKAFEEFANMAFSQGYICLPPDFKESEPRITYGTEENLARMFNVSVPYFRSKIGSWGKWNKYVWTPTKVHVEEEVTCMYLESPDRSGWSVEDGQIPCFFTWDVVREAGGKLWTGLTNFVQIRHHVPEPDEDTEIGIAIKGLGVSDGQPLLDVAKRVLIETGKNPLDYGNLMVLNQHSIKYFDGGLAIKKLENRQIWKQKARLVGIKVRPKGSSRVSGQEVSQRPDAIRIMLKHHGLEEAANMLVQYVKGTPKAILEHAGHFEKVDTNQYLNLLYMIRDKNGNWFQNKMPSVHNRHLAMSESLYRDRIIGTKINTKSAYQYRDSRCDDAIIAHFNETGTWRLFVVPELGSKLDEEGRIIYIKAPNHSRFCLVTAYAIKDENGDYIFAPEGGMGLPNLLSNLIPGLDFDGDKAGYGEHPANMPSLDPRFDTVMGPKVKEEKAPFVPPETLEEVEEMVISNSRDAANATFAIGYVSLAIRYCIMYCNLNGIEITDAMALEIGRAQEDGIQAGAKTVKKNEGEAVLDCSTACEDPEGLIESCFLFMENLIGHKFPRFSDWGDLDPKNLAEICHQLMNRGGGSKSRSHTEIFKHRVNTVLPAYKAHTGDKSGFARDFAFDILANAGLEDFMEPDKSHCDVFGEEYRMVWEVVKSAATWTAPDGSNINPATGEPVWKYSFTLEQIVGFGDWLHSLYSENTSRFIRDYSGYTDWTTGELLKSGHWDAKLKQEHFQRMNRALRFFFAGIEPHGYDLEFNGLDLGDSWKKFYGIYKNKTSEWFKFLVFVFVYIGGSAIYRGKHTGSFNSKGKLGNSGGVCMRFPSSVHVAAKRMYYEVTEQGKKEAAAGHMNPYLDLVDELATKFEKVQLKNDLDWVRTHPYEVKWEMPDEDSEGFDVDSISEEYDSESYDYSE